MNQASRRKEIKEYLGLKIHRDTVDYKTIEIHKEASYERHIR